MYQCRITITLFGKDLAIEERLRRIVPLERFEHEIAFCPSLTPEALGAADIAVIDLPLRQSLHELRGGCKPGALLILCMEAERLAALDEAELEAVDDVWLSPLTSARLASGLRRHLAALKERKDRRLTETYLNTTIDSIPDLVWFKDVRGAHLKVNDAFCDAVGKTKRQIEGRGHYYIWDLKKEEYEKGEYVCLETDDTVLEKGRTCLFDEMVKSRRGMLQFKTYKSPLFDEDGAIMGTVGIAHDVTALKNMDVELEIILGSIPFAVLIRDAAGRVVKVNAKFEEYFQIAAEKITGSDYADWKRAALGENLPVGPDGNREFTVRLGGKTAIMEIHEEPLLDVFQQEVGRLCLCRDVTIERTFERELLHSANTDALTGLYKRRYFYAALDKNRNRERVSLLYLDIDNFKSVNDRYGHQCGDEALIIVARLLRESFPDDLVARVGGDEFLIALLGDCGLRALEERARGLLDRIADSFQSSARLEGLSASIGIAQSDDSSLNIDELIRRSDMALYKAKASGKARCCVFIPCCPSLSEPAPATPEWGRRNLRGG